MGNQFKKGDRVRAISLSGEDKKAGLKVGMCGTVVSNDGYEIIVAFEEFTPASSTHVRDDGYFMLPNQLEMLPLRSFKKGDRVLYVGDTTPTRKGKTGTVTDPASSDSGDRMIMVQYDDLSTPVTSFALNLELITTQAEMPFKPGDRVRALENSTINFMVKGDLGTVESISPATCRYEGFMVTVKWDRGLTYSVYSRRIGIVTPKSKADELVEALAEANRKYREAQKRVEQIANEAAKARRELEEAQLAMEAAKDAVLVHAGA